MGRVSLKTRLDKLDARPAHGYVNVYGTLYPPAIAKLLTTAPAYLTRAEADELRRYRYEHDAGYRELSDRPIPTRALEVTLEVLVRRDFVVSEGYETLPGEVARELLARPDASLEATEQARRYLASGKR